MRRPLLTALMLVGFVAANAYAACPPSQWPDYKPNANAFTADTMLRLIITDAESHIADKHPLSADWMKVKDVAIKCRTNDPSHVHGNLTCNQYWHKVRNAFLASPNGGNALYCFSELNHADTPQPTVPPQRR